MKLQLDVWREACRHIEIDESVTRIAPLLSRRLPVDAIILRRVDMARSRLETVAVGMCRVGTPPQRSRIDCSADDMERVVAWCRLGKLSHCSAETPDPVVKLLLPAGLRGDVVVGPLTNEEGPVGVVIFLAMSPRTMLAEHEDVIQGLLEPFTVALENDRHFHELARLREALEADKQALLSRLGRQEIVESLVGSDAGLKPVMERVEQVAHTDAPVLILGETGSGKEVVARAIHTRSRRAGGPIVRVNCGAIPPELVDSELFGHERGSFTGAINTRKGWFERADGGTLFLDEVAELPLAAQVRLLRILQDGSFERVGGQRSLTCDVRIVAATHRDMHAMVSSGAFREDLWYRISIFPIRLPPLRERIEDIPALAAHFAWRAGVRLGGGPLAPTPDDVAMLVSYHWPGNVRELAAVIERAAILGDGRRLEIPRALGTATPGPGSRVVSLAPMPQPAAPPPPPPPPGLPNLNAAMAQHIVDALNRTHGRIEGPHGAAALLGINPHTLRSRMRKLGIEWRRFRG